MPLAAVLVLVLVPGQGREDLVPRVVVLVLALVRVRGVQEVQVDLEQEQAPVAARVAPAALEPAREVAA